MTDRTKTREPDVDDHAFIPSTGEFRISDLNNRTDPCALPSCGAPRWRHQHDAGTEPIWLNAEENRLLRAAAAAYNQTLMDERREWRWLPQGARDAIDAEYDGVLLVWGRLASMPEVGEK